MSIVLLTGLFSHTAETLAGEGRNLTVSGAALVTETETVISDTVSVRSLYNDFTLPSGFLTKKRITLNGMRRSVSDDSYLVLNVDGDYVLSGLESRDGVEISSERVSYNGLPAFHLTVSAGSHAAQGVHKKNIVIKDRNSERCSRGIRFTVVISKKNRTVNWKRPIVTLNSNAKGEYAVNSPEEEGISIAPLSSNRYRPRIPAELSLTLLNENTVKIKAGSGMKLNKSYPVTLWFIYADSASVRTVKKKFLVKLVDRSEGMRLKKASGSSDVTLHYKPVIKNTGKVLNRLEFKDAALSENYILEKTLDPGTGEITDIYISLRDRSLINAKDKGFSFNAELGNAGMDAKTTKMTPGFSVRGKTKRLKLSFVSGNVLKTTTALSDNKVAGDLEVYVSSEGFARIDPKSIKDLTDNRGFKCSWTVDSYCRSARIRIVADRSRLLKGKTYKLTWSLRAASGGPQTRLTVKYKA